MPIKTTYRKLEPRVVYYRDFKYFCNNSFKESLQKAFSQNLGVRCDEIYESFAASCNNILDNHAPLKKKCVRVNHSHFMNKSFRSSHPEVFLLKGVPENMQQVYRRTTMPKCDFNKVALSTLLKSPFGMDILL